MEPSPIGDRVRRLRASAGLSARELSLAAGLSHSLVGHIESGRVRRPSADTLGKLAPILGVSIDRLVTGKRDAHAQKVRRAAKRVEARR